MKRRKFILQSGAALAGMAIAKSAAPLAAHEYTRMNLLFITVDDMDGRMQGYLGNKNHLTPSLDALAARSHRFVNNRTAAAICQPSREAMMTGLLPHHSGGLGFNPVHEGTPTLVTLLKAQGYFTTGIHKLEHMAPESCFPWDLSVPGSGRAPSEYAEAVRNGIEKARAAGKPFFINCNINDPHRPFYGSPAAAQIDHDEQGEYHDVREVGPDEVEVPPFLEDLPIVRKELAQYANSTQRADVSIGKILDVLAATPEGSNTIIFFSADHGMPFPFSKATVYNSGSHTPALLHYPGMGQPRTFEQRTCNIDYAPTLLDLLHTPAPEGVDGRSWQPLIHGGERDNREYLVTYINTVSSGAAYPMRALQDDRYSLIFMPWSDGKLQIHIDGMTGLTYAAMKAAAENNPQLQERMKQWDFGVPLALYDLKSDPGQRINLIDHAQYKMRAEKMKSLLHEEMRRTKDPQLGNYEALLQGQQPLVTQPKRRTRRQTAQPEPVAAPAV
jgi:N-sulfoglucosamine sulfohydrolase